LERDKNVLGKEWLSTYGNWFSDEENIQLFIDAVKPILPDRALDILYVASASGLLGERFVESLGRGTLTIVDMSQKHLDENKNPKTIKICSDLLEMDLGKKFDVIIMRSALDYFPSRLLQVSVLKILKNHLIEGGLFVNQPAYISDPEERAQMSEAYTSIDKIGNRLFQSSDLDLLYTEAGFGMIRKIGESKDMNLTEQEHIERYELTSEEVARIQTILGGKGNNFEVTEQGYRMRFEFPIFLAS
jgi:hypothetical protein